MYIYRLILMWRINSSLEELDDRRNALSKYCFSKNFSRGIFVDPPNFPSSFMSLILVIIHEIVDIICFLYGVKERCIVYAMEISLCVYFLLRCMYISPRGFCFKSINWAKRERERERDPAYSLKVCRKIKLFM